MFKYKSYITIGILMLWSLTKALAAAQGGSAKEILTKEESVKEIFNWARDDLDAIKFKKDRYRKTRGGNSELLKISCAACNDPVCLYQKDGPGDLLRCYMDRILRPQALTTPIADYLSNTSDKKPEFKCTNCGITIGTPMIYKPEKRDAFSLRKGFFIKETIKH